MMYLIIFFSGFIWITRDIIRVSETFNDSWFKQFKGHWYIDPQVSWVNKGNYHMLLYPILSMFGDLFHTLGTVLLFNFFVLIFICQNPNLSFWLYILIMFLLHGSGIWLGYQLWRKILNKPKK